MYENEFELGAINIPGIDAQLGSDMYDGELDIFVAALRSFATHIPAALNSLSHVSAETLHEYATTVHGLKGSCASIGAEDLRARAADLEAKAKAGGLAGILALNEGLLEDVKTLIRHIHAWLDQEI